jgi:MFS family permease
MEQVARQTPAMLTFGPAVSVWLLGLTQIIGYGTLYYGFGVMADAIARDFGWAASRVFGVLSVGFLLGGLAAPVTGRLIDGYGAPRVMAWGSVASALALVLTAQAATPALFVAGMLLAQIAAMSVLYEAAFACLVQICGTSARSRINQLTLIAGFASSLFWPLTTALVDWINWRDTLLIYAAANMLICAPVHGLMLRARPTSEAGAAGLTGLDRVMAPAASILPEAVQREALILVAIGFALGGFLLSGALALMLPLLTSLGIGASSVLVSTLFGPSQFLVRFGNLAFGNVRHPIVASLLAAALIPLAGIVLALTAPSVIGACLFAVILGFGSGLKSIVQGTLPLALFGTLSYGANVGRIASARLALGALAPFALAWLMETAGPRVALVLLALVGAFGFAAFVRVAGLCRAHRAS